MRRVISLSLIWIFCYSTNLSAGFSDASEDPAAAEIEQALHLDGDPERGKKVYQTCAACHLPEGWGRNDGYYPQIAGQHASVTIKQLADTRARNRDTPTMLPFAMRDALTLQQIADVSAYVERLPMTPTNGIGPGRDLARGEELYRKNCTECHGDYGEGIAKKHMPLIAGQHYEYLVRQFHWIRDGKRRNADEEMVKQIQGFSETDIAAIMDYVSRLEPPIQKIAAPNWRNPDFPKFVRNSEPY